MIVIRRNHKGTKLRKRIRVRDYIFEENPHPNSMAAMYLMKREYFRLDETTQSQPWFEQLQFNTAFLEEQLLLKGDLVCVYCGKKGLMIENPNQEYLATADHVKPKALGGAALDKANLAVACRPCNSKKAAKMGYRISEDKCVFENYPGELDSIKEVNEERHDETEENC